MKPQTTDKINYDLTGCTVRFLGIDDILESSDFIRDTVESGYNGGFNTTYKSDNWNGLAWHLLGDELSGWIGMTYAEYMYHSIKRDNYKPNPKDMWHEIVRVI